MCSYSIVYASVMVVSAVYDIVHRLRHFRSYVALVVRKRRLGDCWAGGGNLNECANWRWRRY
jgi:hypothetical protein